MIIFTTIILIILNKEIINHTFKIKTNKRLLSKSIIQLF